ncbi:FtsX-like permease family protein [Buchnera aphidicola]|uniref:FtsX-like permease family protein n=1 Tax=Buchnera aphidicola TaxID=9 RepID=UPI003CE4FC9C
MYTPIYLFIAIRYLWNMHLTNFKKIFMILSITSIMISTVAIIVTISMINGSEHDFKKNIMSFVPHLIITNNDQYVRISDFPKKILQINNVETVSNLISKEVIAQSKNNISMAEIIGIDATNNYNIKNYNQKNILKILKSGQYNIIIGAQLAKKLNVCIGDTINLILLSDKKNNFSGEIFNQHIFKIINIFSTNNEIDYYQIIMNKQDSLNFLDYSKNYISGWRIWLYDPLHLNLNTFKKITNQFILLDWKLQKGELFKAMKIEKYIMFFLFFLILIISILNIFINLTTYIAENQCVIAILQTQGLSNWKIMLTFIIFGSSNVIIGSTLGTIIAMALIIQSNFLKYCINYFVHESNISLILVPYQILLINIASILFAIFATLYPSWRAIQSKPAQVLNNE